MSKRIRRIHSPAVKAKVALAAMKNDKGIAEIAQQFERFTRRRSASGVGNSWSAPATCSARAQRQVRYRP